MSEHAFLTYLVSFAPGFEAVPPELATATIALLAVNLVLYVGYVVWVLQRRKAPLAAAGSAA